MMISKYRLEVPGLNYSLHGRPLVYCDWAATSQMPQCVIDTVVTSMRFRANIHRGVHSPGAKFGKEIEEARGICARFIGAKSSELIFTSGSTQGLNILAQSAAQMLQKGDAIVLSAVEHHANLLPWLRIAKEKELLCLILPMQPNGTMDLQVLDEYLAHYPVKIIAVPLISNILGSVQPISEMVQRIQHRNIRVIVDAAQAVAHCPIRVQDLGVDALVFGGHKLYGPTGTGCLWIRSDWLALLQPTMLGGGIVQSVCTPEYQLWEGYRAFEPGTPNIAGYLGLARAISWLEDIGWSSIQEQEDQLRQYLQRELESIPELELLNRNPDIPLFCFALTDIHAHDIGTLLDLCGILVRTGRHCVESFHEAKGWEASTRISLSFLNTLEECSFVVEQLRKSIRQLQ